jgi:hypothetical protein
MPPSLTDLEARRAELLRQMLQLSDMRSGSITKTAGRCGNPRCHCHQPNSSGHGPYDRLTRKVKGKTVTETFSSADAMKKAERELSEFHRFQQLSRDLVQINEQICRLRPVVEEEPSAGEKKRPTRSGRKSFKK